MAKKGTKAKVGETPAAGATATAMAMTATAPAQPEVAKKARPRREKKKIVVVTAKRKESIARAVVQPGKGVVRVNKLRVEAMQNPYTRDIIS